MDGRRGDDELAGEHPLLRLPARKGGNRRNDETGDQRDAGGKPALQTPPALAGGQKQDAEANFAEDDRIDDEFPFVFTEPIQYAPDRVRLCRLAQDVSVHEVSHKVSVDSDSIATKN